MRPAPRPGDLVRTCFTSRNQELPLYLPPDGTGRGRLDDLTHYAPVGCLMLVLSCTKEHGHVLVLTNGRVGWTYEEMLERTTQEVNARSATRVGRPGPGPPLC